MFHRDQLVGQWHRNDESQFERFSEFAQLNADGTFIFSFYTHTLDGGLITEISEIGEWGLVGDVHFTITKEEVEDNQNYLADMNDEGNYHAYKVLILDEKSFTYQHIVSGEKFTLYRVAQHN